MGLLVGTIQVLDIQNANSGSQSRKEVTLAFSSSYNNTGNDLTTGDTLRAIDLGLFNITRIDIPDTEGFLFQPLYNIGSALTLPALARVKVFEGVSGNTGSTTATNQSYTPTGTVSQPIFTADGTLFVDQTYNDVLGGATDPNENNDEPEVLNANYIADYTTVSGGSWTVGAIVNQPDVPRAVLISIKNDSGGPLDLHTPQMIWSITGTDQYDNVIFSNAIINSTGGNKTIANGSFRATATARPFKTVTNVTLNNVPDNGLKISVGLSAALAILNPLKNLLTTDVVRVSLNQSNVTPITTPQVILINPAYQTVDCGDLVDGDNVQIIYQTLSGSSGTVSQPTFTGDPETILQNSHTHSAGGGAGSEVSNGTNLSSILGTVKATVYGY